MPPSNREYGDVPERVKGEIESRLVYKVFPDYSRGKEAHHWHMCWDAQTATENWFVCEYPDERVGGCMSLSGGVFIRIS